jgi:hypothetical protein
MNKISQPTVILHEALIRYAKGMLKAWEEWLKASKTGT